MKQQKIIPGPVLMILSIAGITVFMFYWLKESYKREEKALSVKTAALFDRSVRQLQVSKLKLSSASGDSLPDLHFKRIIHDDNREESLFLSMPAKKGIVSTINVIQGKLKDSIKKSTGRVSIT